MINNRSFVMVCPKCYIKWKSNYLCFSTEKCSKCIFDVNVCFKCNKKIDHASMRIRKDDNLYHVDVNCAPVNLCVKELTASSYVLRDIVIGIKQTLVDILTGYLVECFKERNQHYSKLDLDKIIDYLMTKNDDIINITKLLEKYCVEYYNANNFDIYDNVNSIYNNIYVICNIMDIFNAVATSI